MKKRLSRSQLPVPTLEIHPPPQHPAGNGDTLFSGTLLSASAYQTLTPLHKLRPRQARCGTLTRKLPVRLEITSTSINEYALAPDGSKGALLATLAVDFVGFALVKRGSNKRNGGGNRKCQFVLSDNSGDDVTMRVFEVASTEELALWFKKLRLARGDTSTCVSASVDRMSRDERDVPVAAEPIISISVPFSAMGGLDTAGEPGIRPTSLSGQSNVVGMRRVPSYSPSQRFSPRPPPSSAPPWTAIGALRNRASNVQRSVEASLAENRFAIGRLDHINDELGRLRIEINSTLDTSY